ncbi:MAG: hypothetical protein EOO65_01350 [Methanosarcinales archaeon]|nr:MAG: hypothetical protein EOO65_01350 [Methanosarcinales archaeon]
MASLTSEQSEHLVEGDVELSISHPVELGPARVVSESPKTPLSPKTGTFSLTSAAARSPPMKHTWREWNYAWC